jgi:hypothetical protein
MVKPKKIPKVKKCQHVLKSSKQEELDKQKEALKKMIAGMRQAEVYIDK